MLTEAYTSLLAALTVWGPAERQTRWTETDRPEMHGKTKRYSEVTNNKTVTETTSLDRWVKKGIGTGGLTDKKISGKKAQLNAHRKAKT